MKSTKRNKRHAAAKGEPAPFALYGRGQTLRLYQHKPDRKKHKQSSGILRKDTTMRLRKLAQYIPLLLVLAVMALPVSVGAVAYVQCPEDTNGDGIADIDIPDVRCMHLTGGDGFVNMADGKQMYVFSFSNVTDVPQAEVLSTGVFRANQPAPPITINENEKLYLTLTNVGTFVRPDLFDPHTVHYHGFPNASNVFDGVPELSIAINQQASLTYFYNNVEPGTYMYHCHVEATEHMQMGMNGSLHVKPAQNALADGTDLNGYTHTTGQQYVYNDGDGSTRYDVEYSLLLHGMYDKFHDASFNTQPLPFAEMVDTYALINGRGYPDTTVAGPLPNPPPDSTAPNGPQPVSSFIQASQGQRILLRIINLGVVRQYSITAQGLPMIVVGKGARMQRGNPQGAGANIFVETNHITLGGGMSADVIIDTSGIRPGTYFLHTTNMNYLSNRDEDYGGMMTEIRITN